MPLCVDDRYPMIPVRETAAGQMRWATEADRPLLRQWIAEFEAEALPNHPPTDHELWVDRALHSENRGILLWEDQQPVTMSAYAAPTPHGIRIGPVYTP